MFQCDKGHKPLAAMAAWASTPQQATMVAKSGVKWGPPALLVRLNLN